MLGPRNTVVNVAGMALSPGAHSLAAEPGDKPGQGEMQDILGAWKREMRKSLPKLRLENEELRGGTGRGGGYSRKDRRMVKPGGEGVHRTSRD